MKKLILLLAVFSASLGSAHAATLFYVAAAITGGGTIANSDFYSLSTATGIDSFVATIPGVFYTDLAASPIPDTIYAVDTFGATANCLHTFNVVTKVDAVVGCTPVAIQQLGYDARHDILYATDNSSLYLMNRTNGATTLIGSFGGPVQMFGMDYEAATNTLYGINGSFGAGVLYTIDVTTGAATVVGPAGLASGGPIDLYVDPASGQMYGVGNTAKFYSIDKTTGAATIVGPGTSENGRDLAAPLLLSIAQVPTLSGPGMAILATSILALGMGLLRRRAGGPAR